MKENKKEKIECYVVSIIMLFMPLLMFLHWLIIGYWGGHTMITTIWCSWKEFDEYKLDKKYNLVDYGMSKKHAGYKWLYDSQNNVNVYVRWLFIPRGVININTIVKNVNGEVLSDAQLRNTIIISKIYYENINAITSRILKQTTPTGGINDKNCRG